MQRLSHFAEGTNHVWSFSHRFLMLNKKHFYHLVRGIYGRTRCAAYYPRAYRGLCPSHIGYYESHGRLGFSLGTLHKHACKSVFTLCTVVLYHRYILTYHMHELGPYECTKTITCKKRRHSQYYILNYLLWRHMTSALWFSAEKAISEAIWSNNFVSRSA